MKDIKDLVGHKKQIIPKIPTSMVGAELYELVTKEKHGTPFSFNIMKIEPGGEVKKQAHHDQHAIYILRGICRVLFGDEWMDMEEGAYAYIPPDLSHSFANAKEDTTEILILKL